VLPLQRATLAPPLWTPRIAAPDVGVADHYPLIRRALEHAPDDGALPWPGYWHGLSLCHGSGDDPLLVTEVRLAGERALFLFVTPHGRHQPISGC